MRRQRISPPATDANTWRSSSVPRTHPRKGISATRNPSQGSKNGSNRTLQHRSAAKNQRLHSRTTVLPARSRAAQSAAVFAEVSDRSANASPIGSSAPRYNKPSRQVGTPYLHPCHFRIRSARCLLIGGAEPTEFFNYAQPRVTIHGLPVSLDRHYFISAQSDDVNFMTDGLTFHSDARSSVSDDHQHRHTNAPQ